VVGAVSGLILLERLTSARVAVPTSAMIATALVVGIGRGSGVLVAAAALMIVSIAIGAALVALAREVLDGRAAMLVAVLFVLPHLALPFAQPAGIRIFEDDFVAFANDVRAGQIPRAETFTVGPYTYNGVCGRPTGSVFIWHSDDGFMRVPTVVVREDGTIAIGSLGENDGAIFECDRDRARQ